MEMQKTRHERKRSEMRQKMSQSYDEFIKVPKYFLIAGGFWPFSISDSPLKTKLYRFYGKFQTTSYVCFIASLVFNLNILVFMREDETRIFSGINVLIVVFETCVKLLIFQIGKIPNMFEHVMRNELRVHQSNDEEVKTCYKEQAHYCRMLNITQFILTISSTGPFTVFALLELYRSDDFTEYKNQPFMHDLWYPFRRETHMPWVILLNLLMVTQGTCLNTATQSTFINLMIYASSRFKILIIKLRKFDDIAHEENCGDVMTTVKMLIKEHQDLLHFVKSLNERTRYVMLMEFLLNSVSLASGTIQLVVVTTLSRLIIPFSIVALQMFQIFLLAWSANEISQEGLLVADAIGSSKWDKQNPTIRKLFLMMIMRAQVPIGLTAGPFFRMSTNTAVTTVKAAYTYLSLMMRNYEE